MVPLVKAGGQVLLGLPHERLVQADYSLQQQDRKLLVDATTQAVNLSLPPISELIEGTHFQLVIVEMGLGISIDGSALPSDVEQVFIQVKESEYTMTYKLQQRDTDAPKVVRAPWDTTYQPTAVTEHNTIILVTGITAPEGNGLAVATTYGYSGYAVIGDSYLAQDEGDDWIYTLLERKRKENTIAVTNPVAAKTLVDLDVYPYNDVHVLTTAETASAEIILPTPKLGQPAQEINPRVEIKALAVGAGQSIQVKVPAGIKLEGVTDGIETLLETESHTYIAVSDTEWAKI